MNSPTEDPRGPADVDLTTVIDERRQLMGLCYRLLGSMADADEIVQETYVRWFALTDRERQAIETPGGWLTKVAGRLCLDLLRSARHRRERYVGEWIPEPVPDRGLWQPTTAADDGDPADRVTLDESISMAFLVMLESMTPAERVSFILHDVFRYSFAEVAEIVGRTPAACRQLASSARRRLREVQSPAASTSEHAVAVRRFKEAWVTGDITTLLGILDPGVKAVADGGGAVTAELRPISGAGSVARTLVDLLGKIPDLDVAECVVNGQPGLVAQQGGVTVTVFAFRVAGARITHIWAVRNPAKLRPWTAG